MPQETCEVKVRRGENVDRALRRLKKALDKEGIIAVCVQRFYENQVKANALRTLAVPVDKSIGFELR